MITNDTIVILMPKLRISVRDIRFCYPGDILENLVFSVTIKLIQTALGEQNISMCT